MIKAVLFLDGSWLTANHADLAAQTERSDFQLDYAKLPRVIAAELRERACANAAIDVVRAHYFASYADNHAACDQPLVDKRLTFFDRLRGELHYEVTAFPVDYQGRRVRRADRDVDDRFTPREKCVDVALSVTAMRYAAQANTMDLAVFVLGDRDFVPLFSEMRRAGKRVALISSRDSCADELSDPADRKQLRDYAPIWLEDLLPRLERPRPPLRAVERQREEDSLDGAVLEAAHGCAEVLVPSLWKEGVVKNIIWDRGFGFITAEDGRDYFFHANVLADDLDFAELQPEMRVRFSIKTEPHNGRAGAADRVCSLSGVLPSWAGENNSASPHAFARDDRAEDASDAPDEAGDCALLSEGQHDLCADLPESYPEPPNYARAASLDQR